MQPETASDTRRAPRRTPTDRAPRQASSTKAPRVARQPCGQLVVHLAGDTRPVHLRRCFPWSSPTQFLSLRDDESEEVLLVRDVSELDPGSRDAVEAALLEASMLLEIVAVTSVEEDFEMRCFEVQTRQGKRSFQTARDAWPRSGPRGGLLIEDVGGDIYWVPPRDQLDRRSQRLLWAFLD